MNALVLHQARKQAVRSQTSSRPPAAPVGTWDVRLADVLRQCAWTLDTDIRHSAARSQRVQAVRAQGHRLVQGARRAKGRAKDGASFLKELRQRLGVCCMGDPATLSGGLLAASAAPTSAEHEGAAATAPARRSAQSGLRTHAAADPAAQGQHPRGTWRRLRLCTRVWPAAPAKAAAAGQGSDSRDAHMALQRQGSRGPAEPRVCGAAASSAASAAEVLAALDTAAAAARDLGWFEASFSCAALPRSTANSFLRCSLTGQTAAAGGGGQAPTAVQTEGRSSGKGWVSAGPDTAAGAPGAGQGSAGVGSATDPGTEGLAAEATRGTAIAQQPAGAATGAARGLAGPMVATNPQGAGRAAEGPQGAEAPLVLPFAALEGAVVEEAFAADSRGEGASSSDTPADVCTPARDEPQRASAASMAAERASYAAGWEQGRASVLTQRAEAALACALREQAARDERIAREQAARGAFEREVEVLRARLHAQVARQDVLAGVHAGVFALQRHLARARRGLPPLPDLPTAPPCQQCCLSSFY